MTNSSPVTAQVAHIEALLDDPMISLIMTIDRIDRDDARQLFCRVARRLKVPSRLDPAHNGAAHSSTIFFPEEGRDSQAVPMTSTELA